MNIKIIMDSGKEYIVESKENTIGQYAWTNFENKNSIINSFVKIQCEGSELMINPSHISSLEEISS